MLQNVNAFKLERWDINPTSDSPEYDDIHLKKVSECILSINPSQIVSIKPSSWEGAKTFTRELKETLVPGILWLFGSVVFEYVFTEQETLTDIYVIRMSNGDSFYTTDPRFKFTNILRK